MKLTKLLFISLLAAMLGLFAVSCSDDDNAGSKDDDNAGSKDDDASSKKISISTVKTLTNMGTSPNQLLVDGDYAYTVASSDNVIMRLDLNDFTLNEKYIDLGENANPYAMTKDGEDIYIVNSMANTLVKVNTSDPASITTLLTVSDGLNMPMDVLVKDGTVYVANADYDESYQPHGRIAWLAADGTKGVLEGFETKNLTSLYTQSDSSNLFVVSSGSFQYDENYTITSTLDSGILIASLPMSLDATTYLLKNEDVGKLAFTRDGNQIFVGSSYSKTLHVLTRSGDDATPKYSANSLSFGKDTGMLMPKTLDDTHVALIDFNSDSLYIIDMNDDDIKAWATSTELVSQDMADKARAAIEKTKFRFSESSFDRRGPISMSWDPKRNQLLVLHSLSETIDVLKIFE